MSVTNGKPAKKKPRAMPVETIVTRYKSAQQKRQLEKDPQRVASKPKNTKNTQPDLKNTETKSKRGRKPKKQKLENFERVNEDKKIENKEYYPNKLKRKVLNARTFLAPKHSFKIISGTKSCSKRKLYVPRRDEKYIREQKSQPSIEFNIAKSKGQSPELSIVDMVRIIEENGSLDDEDLLEILTCPSPVWWEEPPDGFIEEALFSQPRQAEERISVKSQLLEEQMKYSEHKHNQDEKEKLYNKNKQDIESDNPMNLPDSFEISIESRDKSFINKRCKLEALLGVIKDKVNKPIVSKVDSQKNVHKVNADVNCIMGSVKRSKNVNIEENDTKIRKKIKKNSGSTDEDLLELRDDDEILNHLENLNIPIEDDNQVSGDLVKDANTRKISLESNTSDRDIFEEYLDLSLLDDDDKNGDRTDCVIIDVKNDVISIDDDKQSTDEVQLNIEDGNNEEVIKDGVIEVNNIDLTDDVEIDKDKNEFVTVYKILTNDAEVKNEASRLNKQIIGTKPNVSSNIKRKDDRTDGKINTYYKQSKKIFNVQTKPGKFKNIKLNIIKNKSIVISECEKVKYCFICSSIFETNVCNYCMRRNLKRKTGDLSCDVCGFSVDNKQDMIKHLSEHRLKPNNVIV